MDVLIRFGFTIEEINNMMETNQSIDEISDNNINELINILKKINCTEKEIKNIISCNPFYLSKNIEDVKQLIKRLQEIGCTYLNLLLDTNPYLLNMEKIELDKLYNKKIHEGLSKEEIINYMNNNIVF